MPTTKPEEPVFAPAPVATTQSSIKAQVSLTIPSTANITTEELQSVTVKAGLETQLAAAIGIDVQYVTITAIYLCPGDTRCDTTNRRELQHIQMFLKLLLKQKHTKTVCWTNLNL